MKKQNLAVWSLLLFALAILASPTWAGDEKDRAANTGITTAVWNHEEYAASRKMPSEEALRKQEGKDEAPSSTAPSPIQPPHIRIDPGFCLDPCAYLFDCLGKGTGGQADLDFERCVESCSFGMWGGHPEDRVPKGDPTKDEGCQLFFESMAKVSHSP